MSNLVPEVALVVDGETVELSDFVRRFLVGAVVGMHSVLKDVPDDPREIRVHVRRSRPGTGSRLRRSPPPKGRPSL